MAKKCRAVVFNGDGTYELRQFDKPMPPPGGAVIKVEAVGMCSTDVAQLAGHVTTPGQVYPAVPGHEMLGRVEAFSKDAHFPVSIGDRVAVDLVLRTGLYHEKLLVYGYTMGLDVEGGLWGGYGEYMCIAPGTNLMKLTESVPAEHLTIFEPLANAVNWVSTAGVRQGDTVVVQGPGHNGLMCIIAAKMAGASSVIATGVSSDALRLAAARIAGADHVINVDKEDVVQRVKEITNGWGARVVMDCTSSTVAVQRAFDLVMFGGTILLAGYKDEAPTQIVSDKIISNALTIRGGLGSTEESMKTAVKYLNEGHVPTKDLLGEVLPLDRFDEALQLLKRVHPKREAFRVTIKYG